MILLFASLFFAVTAIAFLLADAIYPDEEWNEVAEVLIVFAVIFLVGGAFS